MPLKKPHYLSEKSSKKFKILFVCLGNICRSPAAEGIMKSILHQRGLENIIEADSAGIGSWHIGELPDIRIRRCGVAHGYNFCSRARKIHHEDLLFYDIVVVMDDNNRREILSLAKTNEERKKIFSMHKFCRNHNDWHSIPDPYYGEERDFELVIELLEDACEGLLDYLLRSQKVPFT